MYMTQAKPSWRRLERQAVREAFILALERAGSSMAARMAMMAMTTSSSIRVKARLEWRRDAETSSHFMAEICYRKRLQGITCSCRGRKAEARSQKAAVGGVPSDN